MLKKILLALGLSFLVSSSAFAACTNPLPITSGGGSPATVNMSVSQNTADAGCMYNITPMQGGGPLSATNGWFTNILQGNAALSASNPLFVVPGTSGFTVGQGAGGGAANAWSVVGSSQATTLSAWNSATTVNTTQAVMAVGQGAPAILVQLNQTSTLTVGAVTFEGSFDNTNWVTIPVAQVLNPNTLAPLTNPYTLVASTNQPFLILTQGYQAIRIRLSTAITGTATVTPFVLLLPYNPTIGGILNPTAISQTTDGITNGVRLTNAYPAGATPITATATGTTAATTATLAGTSGKTTYVCSYSVRANATAAANVQNTITGLLGGTRTDQMWVAPLASGLGVDEQVFWPCIPASTTNTAIAVVSGAPGAGGNVTVNAAGYQQ